MKPIVIAILLASAQLSSADDHYARARELYKGGPSKALEIIAELDLELRERPNNIEAHILKALTQMGINKLDDAIATFDAAEKEAQKAKTIYKNIPFYRAQCLYYKGAFAEAKKSLKPFSGFFLGDKDEEARYDNLMDAINSKLKAAEKSETKMKPK